ncbi:hypothetical protein OUZ56_021930 [Daphnia magna]|uniref:Uncharacterized protein n=1 Tax=Daphnia magna TaxID=35525 RepID=A0ABR0AUV8_9CRUS|nr:hypothetical protein OUZ56_021930 [Daphnia magna]
MLITVSQLMETYQNGASASPSACETCREVREPHKHKGTLHSSFCFQSGVGCKRFHKSAKKSMQSPYGFSVTISDTGLSLTTKNIGSNDYC